MGGPKTWLQPLTMALLSALGTDLACGGRTASDGFEDGYQPLAGSTGEPSRGGQGAEAGSGGSVSYGGKSYAGGYGQGGSVSTGGSVSYGGKGYGGTYGYAGSYGATGGSYGYGGAYPGTGGYYGKGGSGGAYGGAAGYGAYGGYAGAGGQGGSGDCCWLHTTPGCTNGSISSCVCGFDSYCCSSTWDNICVSEVTQLGCGACR